MIKPSSRRGLILAAVVAFAIIAATSLSTRTAFAQAQSQTSTATTLDTSVGLIAAAAAIVGSCASAAYAVAKAASSAAAAIVERPGAFGPMLILAGLGEGIAIYGLLVAFQILSKVP